MSRTWRTIPRSRFKGNSIVIGGCTEERPHNIPYTKEVRDRNCYTHSKPTEQKKTNQRRFRSNESDQLRKIEQAFWKNPTKKVEDDLIFGMEVKTVLPRPKEFQEYYF